MASIFDTVKAEIGAGPAYASRDDFKTVFGYSKGKVLGTFDSVADAQKAGATSTEKSIDEDAYRAARAAYQAHNDLIVATWRERMRAEHSDLNDAVFNIVYGMAYDRGHGSGYGEVELYIDDYADMARKIVAATKAA